MNNLQQVINTMQRGLDNGYVFTHVTKPELQTLLNGLEELKRENAAMKETLEWIDNYRETMPIGASVNHFAAAFEGVESAVDDVLSTLKCTE